MSESKPLIEHDFEFHFLNGSRDYVTAQEGRDVIDEGPDAIRINICHEDGARELVTVYRSALASLKRATREVNTDADQVQKLEAGEAIGA